LRDRPYVCANEPARPYSDVIAERRATDPAAQRRELVLMRIAELEGEAAEAADPAVRKNLQCEAEGLRAALDESAPPRR
jgi:hypothetical protein